MKSSWKLAAAALAISSLGLLGCKSHSQSTPSASAGQKMASQDEIEAGETKVKLDQTPPAVRATIEKELAGAELEDISKKQSNGKTIYETDIIKGGHKWEVIVAEDGSIVHKVQEGSAEEKAEDAKEKAAKADGYTDHFPVDKTTLVPAGSNKYLLVQPGRVLKLKNKDGDTLTITILPETRTVDGARVGVLEERETKNGKLAEISFNFLAVDPKTNDIYYFGEDVDNYKDGKVINHDSAWRAGDKGAKFGMFIPGNPRKGQKFYQEVAPGVALDRIEVASTDETVKTPAGTFEHCLHFRETTPLEGDVSHKYFAPGIGMIKDDEFELAEKP